jgi:transposase
MDYLRARLEAYPGLSAQRLARELGERGYAGGYSTVRDTVRAMRPAGGGKPYAVRFETPVGEQAQVDFAQFRVRFADAPDRVQIVWLFSMVLGFSRLIWGRFVMRQTMPSVLACHRAAFEAIGGVPVSVRSPALTWRLLRTVPGDLGVTPTSFRRSLRCAILF